MNQSNNKKDNAACDNKSIKYTPPVLSTIMLHKILTETSQLDSETKIKADQCVQQKFKHYEPSSLGNFKPINNGYQNKYK